MTYDEFRSTPLMFYSDVSLLYNNVNMKIRIVESSIEHCPPYHVPIHSYKAIAIGTDSPLNSATIPIQGSSSIYSPVTHNLLISGGGEDIVIPCYVDSFSIATQVMDITTMGEYSPHYSPNRKECEIYFHIDESCFEDFPKKEKTFTPFDRFEIMDFD